MSGPGHVFVFKQFNYSYTSHNSHALNSFNSEHYITIIGLIILNSRFFKNTRKITRKKV